MSDPDKLAVLAQRHYNDYSVKEDNGLEPNLIVQRFRAYKEKQQDCSAVWQRAEVDQCH